MAFIYTADGRRYESNFHYWYEHGVQPDPELMVEIVSVKTEGQASLPAETSFVYEDDGQRYYGEAHFYYVNRRRPEPEKMVPVITRRGVEVEK